MKTMKNVFFILSVLYSAVLSAQSVNVRLELEYRVLLDEKERVAKLYIGRDSALFYYEASGEKRREVRESEEFGSTHLSIEYNSGDKLSGQVLTDLSRKKIFSNEKIFRNDEYDDYTVAEPLEFIDWKLEDETRVVNNIQCHKAVGSFKGRRYTCWYAPEIPSNMLGPWKLHGLPGVVLEAGDDEEYIYFQLKKMENKQQQVAFLPIDEEHAITYTLYQELYQEQINEMMEHLRSRLPKGVRMEVTEMSFDGLEKE